MSHRAGTLVAVGATLAAPLPLFLLGSMAVQLRDDLGVDESFLGLAATLRFAAAAISAAAMGRLVGRFGAVRGVRAGATFTAVSLLGTATIDARAPLLALIGLSGVAASTLLPSAQLWVMEIVASDLQGVGFALVQAGQPLSALLAGLAVPTIAGPLGWRWAFIGFAAAAETFAVAVPRRAPALVPPIKPSTAEPDQLNLTRAPLLLLAAGMGCGGAAISCLGAFYVSFATDAGLSESMTELLFAAGAALAIVSRRGGLPRRHQGEPAAPLDRRPPRRRRRGVPAALVQAPRRGVVRHPARLRGVWGWTGLFLLAVARTNPTAGAASVGVTMTGAAIGGTGGPAAFGVLAAQSYTVAWLFAAALALVAAGFMLLARQAVLRARRPAM